MPILRSHRDLQVHKTALEAAKFAALLAFRLPSHEYKLRDQILRCCRSPGASIAEAVRKRRYVALWISKLTDAEAEAAEAQWWLEIMMEAGYCTKEEFDLGFDLFEKLISQIVLMVVNPQKWVSPSKQRRANM